MSSRFIRKRRTFLPPSLPPHLLSSQNPLVKHFSASSHINGLARLTHNPPKRLDDPDRQKLNLIKKLKKAKKKLRETPIIEPLTAPEPSSSNLPFAFRYSYTEVPKVKPIMYQEKFSPFGPGRLDRPWDGQQAPPVNTQVSSDSSNTPPRTRGKIASNGGPNRVQTKEEIHGEPLTKEELRKLLEESFKTKKQLNLGRDGLTHNTLINFYNYWQRDDVIRVKCKGVATVDMENIILQIEDKTCGKVIHRAGGTLHVYRGRYYSKRDRPNIPPMLWRPHSPIYPKLITQKPGGLKLQEATTLRRRGRKIMPLCRLAKNGYYADLVQHVREAFEDDDLVRIDCKALNKSDYKKIGAKLRDLVPCILLSFQGDQILIWKGRSKLVKEGVSMGESSVGKEDGCMGNAQSSNLKVDDVNQVDNMTGYLSETGDDSISKNSGSLSEDINDEDISESLGSSADDVSDDDDDDYDDNDDDDNDGSSSQDTSGDSSITEDNISYCSESSAEDEHDIDDVRGCIEHQ